MGKLCVRCGRNEVATGLNKGIEFCDSCLTSIYERKDNVSVKELAYEGKCTHCEREVSTNKILVNGALKMMPVEFKGPNFIYLARNYYSGGKDSNTMTVCKACLHKYYEQLKLYENKIPEDAGGKRVRKPFAEVFPEFKALKSPRAIKEELDRFVVGQTEAKKSLSVAVYNHYKRIQLNDGLVKKSNVMMIGPSGTGKTLMAECVAKSLAVPFSIYDASSLTQAGYVGNDVEEVLQSLLFNADGDADKAEYGIVFIDEIDKIATKVGIGASDVNGRGVQNALLKIIEGTELNVPVDGTKRTNMGKQVRMDTKNILFICSGAFSDIAEIKKFKGNKNSLGFVTKEDYQVEDEKVFKYSSIEVEDLIKYGMVVEFMGRVPKLVKLEQLTLKEMKDVLTVPEDSIIKEYVRLLKLDGIDLTFEEDAIEYVSKIAIRNNVGARGLRGILEEALNDLMYMLPGSDTTSFNVTKQFLVQMIGGKHGEV